MLAEREGSDVDAAVGARLRLRIREGGLAAHISRNTALALAFNTLLCSSNTLLSAQAIAILSSLLMQIIREGDWQPAIRMAILILRNIANGLASLTFSCANTFSGDNYLNCW